jgi:hypothetical protein
LPPPKKKPPLVELPLMVQSVSVAVPLLYTPPPLPRPLRLALAELPLMVQSVSESVPLLASPPPLPLTLPPLIVSPEIDALCRFRDRALSPCA